MMVEKEDLGLSLSLSFPDNNNNNKKKNTQLNLSPFNLIQKTSWTDSLFPSSGN